MSCASLLNVHFHISISLRAKIKKIIKKINKSCAKVGSVLVASREIFLNVCDWFKAGRAQLEKGDVTYFHAFSHEYLCYGQKTSNLTPGFGEPFLLYIL